MIRRYHRFSEAVLRHFDEHTIEKKYDEGFVFTRLGKGIMHQVRSVRVRGNAFKLSSENRRILRKFARLNIAGAPLEATTYDWRMGKMAKDFYRKKFGADIMSANKIRELCTDPAKSNMNFLFAFQIQPFNLPSGYCIAFQSKRIIHYHYPFYDCSLIAYQPSMGMAMMTKAVAWAQQEGSEYIYLGSIQSEKSLYKFQFEGVEWFNGQTWCNAKPMLQELNHIT